MYRNDALGKNTLYVNDMLVRLFKFILAAIAVIVILRVSGILTMQWAYLLIAAGIGTVICALPIACRHFRMDGNVIKYVNVSCASVFCISGYCLLSTEAIVLLIIPIGFACLYFDIRIIKCSAALSIAGLIIGRLLNGMVSPELYDAAHLLQFGIAAALLIAISKRGLNMLSNAYSYYENINNIFSNIHASLQSLEAAEDILQKGINSLNASKEEDALSSNTMVKGIISNINKSVENAREIMKYTHIMPKARGKDLKTEDGITAIEKYAGDAKELVVSLADCTGKISEDLDLISIIIDEGKLISASALNEADAASSGGRGSAIIAMEVKRLADESVEASTHIHELLSGIASDADNAMNTIAAVYEEMIKSLELINRTVETLIKWLMYKNIEQS